MIADTTTQAAGPVYEGGHGWDKAGLDVFQDALSTARQSASDHEGGLITQPRWDTYGPTKGKGQLSPSLEWHWAGMSIPEPDRDAPLFPIPGK